MKTPLTHTRLVRALAIALAATMIALPLAQATYGYNPSGRYLDLANNRIKLYSGAGTLSDVGVNPIPTQCVDAPTQCGQCQYAPNDNAVGDRKGWESSLSQYTYGWCANVDVGVVTNVVVRGDVQVLPEAGKEWSIRYRIDYMRVGQSAPVDSKVIRPTATCNNDGVTINCPGVPIPWNPLFVDNAPAPGTAWNYYCVHVIVYDTPLSLNPGPVADGMGDASACSGLVH